MESSRSFFAASVAVGAPRSASSSLSLHPHQLQTEYSPDLPKLPLTTITFGLPSFRPPDDLILAATSFSGIPAFIELIDTDVATRLQDPLKTRLQEVVR